MQRGHPYAIVDEVDSILIDEARTPLIISGPADQPHPVAAEFAKIAGRLRREADYKRWTRRSEPSASSEVGHRTGRGLVGHIDNLYESITRR